MCMKNFQLIATIILIQFYDDTWFAHCNLAHLYVISVSLKKPVHHLRRTPKRRGEFSQIKMFYLNFKHENTSYMPL